MNEQEDVDPPRKRVKLSPSHLNQFDGAQDMAREPVKTLAQTVEAIKDNAYPSSDLLKQELNVGITAYASQDRTVFKGILKKRYTDFLVNEILPNGEVLHLRSIRAPKTKSPHTEQRPVYEQLKPATPETDFKTAEPAVDLVEGEEQAASLPTSTSNGEKVAVENKEEQSGELSEEDYATLKQYFSETDLGLLLQLYQDIIARKHVKPRDYGSIKATVTSDRSIRTRIHQDIRRIFSSRIESSTDREGAMILTAALPGSRQPSKQPFQSRNQKRQGKLGWKDRGGEFLHFSIHKENKDTMEVISFLARQLKANIKIFQFGGTKDRRGVTVQRASAYRVEADRLVWCNKSLRNATTGDFEYQRHGLELGDLKGNEFVITLKDCKWEGDQNLSINEKVELAKKSLAPALSDLQTRGFFNYYGLQRFGTFATRTDTVGLKILQDDFEGAVDCILAFSPIALAAAQDLTSAEQISSEDKARAQAIDMFNNREPANKILDILPRRYSAEASIIRHLSKNRTDFAGALQTIQRNLRLMYVHAYQSLIWNFAVGERWRLYGGTVVEGDLVLVSEHKEKNANGAIAEENVDADGEIVVNPSGEDRAHDPDDVFERARPLTTDDASSGKYSIFDIVLPQPGYDVVYPPNGMTDWYKTFMASEQGGGLDPFDMRRKQKDYSLSGGYRKALARIAPEYAFQIRTYEDENEQFVETDLDRLKKGGDMGKFEETGLAEQKREPREGQKIAVVLKMQLGSSQYATMALRELARGGISAYKPDFGGGR